MGDDHDGQAEAVAQLGEQPQDVVPVARVERADRLVAQQQLRSGRQRPGDGDPLPLATGDLARLTVPQRRLEPHLGEGVHDPRVDLRRGQAADLQPLADDVADGQVGVERAQRVLEDQLDVAGAALLAPGGTAQPGDLRAVEHHPAARAASPGPTTVLARVVLPEPVSPTRPTISPGHTVRLTPFSTWLARQPWPSTTSTSVTSSSGRALVCRRGCHRSVSSAVIGWPVPARHGPRWTPRRARGRSPGRSAPRARGRAGSAGCHRPGRHRRRPGSARRTGSR